MIALVDGDIVAYRCSAASEDTDLEICCLRADKVMRDILFLTEADSYSCFLTGSNNFRKTIYPEYKANRKDKPKPKWLQDTRQFLIENWSAVVTEGCEADDALGINQTTNSTICSIDKDLLQIPGKHFNWVKSEFFEQNEIGGLRQFYLQLLQGDRGDNIPGLPGIGPKKAERYLEGCETEQDMFDHCLDLYKGDLETMIRNGKLLWIWRTEGDIWNPTKLIGNNQSKHEVEVKSNSTMLTEVEPNLFTELTDPEINGL